MIFLLLGWFEIGQNSYTRLTPSLIYQDWTCVETSYRQIYLLDVSQPPFVNFSSYRHFFSLKNHPRSLEPSLSFISVTWSDGNARQRHRFFCREKGDRLLFTECRSYFLVQLPTAEVKPIALTNNRKTQLPSYSLTEGCLRRATPTPSATVMPFFQSSYSLKSISSFHTIP